MHNKPHTEEAKKKMRAAIRPRKWATLPEADIVHELLYGMKTVLKIAEKYGCSASTICIIYRKYTTKDERLKSMRRKHSAALTRRKNPFLSEWCKHNNPWIGRKHTEQSKKLQSKAKAGKKQSLSNRIKQSARMQGVDISNWTGFKSTQMERLKNSFEWKSWRSAVFERDDYTCQSCHKRGGKLHPHHVKPKKEYPELVFDVSNGQTLCTDCHKATKSYGKNSLSAHRTDREPPRGGEEFKPIPKEDL